MAKAKQTATKAKLSPKSKPKPKPKLKATPKLKARLEPKSIKGAQRSPRTPDRVRKLASELAQAPGDRALVQVFADALLDEGGEHGIRGELVQVSLVETPAAKARSAELLASFEQSLKNRGITGLAHAGGFVRTWTCSSDDFGSFAQEVFADEPLLREVVIELGHRDVRLQLAMIAATPELARVRRLTLVGHQNRNGRPGSAGLAQLLASPYWPKLEALRLPNCALGDQGAQLLAGAASLCELRELDVTQNDLFSKGVMALAASPHLAQLTWLCIAQNKPGLRGINALATSKQITKLEYIDTSLTWLTRQEVAPLEKRFSGLELRHNKK